MRTVSFSISVPQQSIEGCVLEIEEDSVTVDVTVELGCRTHGDWEVIKSTYDGGDVDPDDLPESLIERGLQLALEGLG